MLTIKTVENIKRGSRLTLFNGIYAVICGLVYLILLNTLLKLNFKKIEVVWQVFSRYNPDISSFLLRLVILKAIFMIAFGIIIVSFSLYILKKKDKSAWAVLFIAGILFWAGLLTMEILDKNIYTVIASFIGWITFVVGMLLPIRYYLQSEYEDY